MSPSCIVWAGRIVRASPSCATPASQLACSTVRGTPHATTARVVFASGARPRPRPGERGAVGPRAVGAAGAGDDRARRGVDHVAAGVDDGKRADHGTAAAYAPVPTPARAAGRPEQLADRRAGAPAPTVPVAGARALAAAVARSPIAASGHSGRPTARSKITAPGTIGTRDLAGVEADAGGRQPAHHAAGGLQPERAPAREQHRVHALDERPRPAQVGLARAGGGAAHGDAGHRPVAAHHDRAAGQRVVVARVPDLDAGHVGDRALGRHPFGVYVAFTVCATTSPSRKTNVSTPSSTEAFAESAAQCRSMRSPS